MPKNTQIPTSPNPPQKSYKYIAVIFIILAFLLVIGVTYMALSKVTITLEASDSKVETTFNLTISDNSTSTDGIVIPGKILSEDSEIEKQFFVDSDNVVDGVAEGTVTIHNNRSVDQPLVATTRLLSKSGILFRIKDRVTVPANGNITAKVYSDTKGSKNNISPTTFTIPGLSESMQKLVYAKSVTAITGGVRKIGVLANSDVEKAENELGNNGSEKILAQFIESLNNKSMILIGSQNKIMEVENDKKIDEEIDSFTLSAKITAKAVFADENKIMEIATEKLEKSVEDNTYINVDPSSLKYEVLNIDTDKNQATIKVTLSGLTTLDSEKDVFDKNLLVGFTEEDLRLYFSQFETINNIEVKFSPFWVKKVPILRDHIIIEIK